MGYDYNANRTSVKVESTAKAERERKAPCEGKSLGHLAVKGKKEAIVEIKVPIETNKKHKIRSRLTPLSSKAPNIFKCTLLYLQREHSN